MKIKKGVTVYGPAGRGYKNEVPEKIVKGVKKSALDKLSGGKVEVKKSDKK